jgi:hypothetical protein
MKTKTMPNIFQIQKFRWFVSEYARSTAQIHTILLLSYLLFSFHKFFGLERSTVEAILIVACLIFFDKNCVLPIMVISGLMVLHWVCGNDLYYYDLANIPLVIMFTKKISISKKQLHYVLLYQILILSFFLGLNEALGLYVEDMRNPGPFASSLHLSYFLICISFGLFITNPIFFYLANSVCVILAILSASRASIIFCFATYCFWLQRYRRPLAFSLFIVVCIFYYGFGRRSLGIEDGNDNVRLMGYLNFFNSLKIENIFYGIGRSEYGSIGIRLHGKESVLVTESSLLMMIYTQGILFTAFFFARFLHILWQISSSVRDGFFIFLIWLALIFLVPFLDSPSISFLNLMLLKSIQSAVASDA